MSRSFSKLGMSRSWPNQCKPGQVCAELARRPALGILLAIGACIIFAASLLIFHAQPRLNGLRLDSRQNAVHEDYYYPTDPGPNNVTRTMNDRDRMPLPLTDEELLAMEANELGGVPIIMYHDVGNREGYLVRSRDNFRKDLQRFYDLGYCLIPLSDYLSGNIRLPAGKSPLVITFDDGRVSQLKLIDAVTADPNCAVGILLDFSRKHPGFGHAATFFVNYPWVFGTDARTSECLRFLLDNGMEIGNHTMSHKNLAATVPDDIPKEIGSLANDILETMDYETLSLALPYGNYPKSKRHLLAGWWDGRHYRNLGVLLAGSEPAPSPFSSQFNPLAIPRILGNDTELDKWLSCLAKYPERRYTSDGQDDTIAVCLDYGIDFVVEREWELVVTAPGRLVEQVVSRERKQNSELTLRAVAPPAREPNQAPDASPLKVRMFATPDTGQPGGSNGEAHPLTTPPVQVRR